MQISVRLKMCFFLKVTVKTIWQPCCRACCPRLSYDNVNVLVCTAHCRSRRAHVLTEHLIYG